MSLYGHRQESFWVELLDHEDNSLGELEGVLGGELNWNANAPIPGAGTLDLEDLGIEIDFSANRVRPYIRLQLPDQTQVIPQADDEAWVEERRNLAPNPVGVNTAVNTGYWRAPGAISAETDAGRPIVRATETIAGTSLYIDPNENFTAAVGDTIRWSATVRTNDPDLASTMRATISAYSGAAIEAVSTVRPVAVDTWTRVTIESVVTAAPEGHYFRTLVWPSSSATDLSTTIDVKDIIVEIGQNLPTDDSFFDGSSVPPDGYRYRWLGEAGASDSVKEKLVRTPKPPIIIPDTSPGFEEWPLGVYVMAAPTTEYSATGKTRSVALTDKITVVKDDCITQTLQVAKGTNIVNAAVAQIEATGETRILATPSSSVLSNTMTWAPGTSRLSIINDLLAVANYWSLSTDRQGQFVLRPYRAPAERPIAWEFEEGALSLHSPDWEHELPLWEATNHVTLVSQEDDNGSVWVAHAIDNSPTSPTSTVNMKRVLNPIIEENVEAESAAALQQQANRKLIENSNVVGVITLDHAFVPVWYRDGVSFTSQGVDTKATVTEMSLALEPGGLVSAKWRQA